MTMTLKEATAMVVCAYDSLEGFSHSDRLQLLQIAYSITQQSLFTAGVLDSIRYAIREELARAAGGVRIEHD